MKPIDRHELSDRVLVNEFVIPEGAKHVVVRRGTIYFYDKVIAVSSGRSETIPLGAESVSVTYKKGNGHYVYGKLLFAEPK